MTSTSWEFPLLLLLPPPPSVWLHSPQGGEEAFCIGTKYEGKGWWCPPPWWFALCIFPFSKPLTPWVQSVCLCECVSVCVSVCVCEKICPYLHTLTHLHTLSNKDKLRHTHTPHTFTHIYPHLHIRKCTYTHLHTRKLAGAGACGCMWVRAHVGDKRAGNGVEAAPIVIALSHKKKC